MGASQADIAAIGEALGRERPDDEFGVWPQNEAIVVAFLAVASQWRCLSCISAGGGQRLLWQGLDYAGVRAGLDGAGLVTTPDLWAGLRIMEAAARDVLNGIMG